MNNYSTSEKIAIYQERKLDKTKTWLLFLFLGWYYGSTNQIGKQIFYYLTFGGFGFWALYLLFKINNSIDSHNYCVATEIELSLQDMKLLGIKEIIVQTNNNQQWAIISIVIIITTIVFYIIYNQFNKEQYHETVTMYKLSAEKNIYSNMNSAQLDSMSNSLNQRMENINKMLDSSLKNQGELSSKIDTQYQIIQE